MFEDNNFSFNELKKKLAEKEFETQIDDARKRYSKEEAETKIKALEEELYGVLYHPSSEDEYLRRMTENGVDIQMYLMDKPALLKSEDICEIQSLMHRNIFKRGDINGKRSLGFFNDSTGKEQMCPGSKILHELDVLDAQIDELENKAVTKEDKFMVACFSAMRVFTIHPSNDGNKRIVKTMMNHAVKCLFPSVKAPVWQSIDKNIIKQAVFGNNIGPFMQEMKKLYSLDIDLENIAITPFSVFHSKALENKSIAEEVEDSRIFKSEQLVRSERLEMKNIRQSTIDELKNELKLGFFNKKKALASLDKLTEPTTLSKFLIDAKALYDRNILDRSQLEKIIYPQLQGYYGEIYLHRDVMGALMDDRFAKVERIISSYENPPQIEAQSYRNIHGADRELNLESRASLDEVTVLLETEIDYDIDIER
jgi:hypothetical protein